MKQRAFFNLFQVGVWLCIVYLFSGALVQAAAPAWMSEPIMTCESSTPAPKMNDGETNRWWRGVHKKQIRELHAMETVDILFVGDSITDGFDNTPSRHGDAMRHGGKAVWDEFYGDRHVYNLGIAGDTTEALLWRLQHGGLEGIDPDVVIMTIGHNNHVPAEEIEAGMMALLKEIRTELPRAVILLIPHFPSTKSYWRSSKQIRAWQAAVERVKGDEKIIPLDLNEAFLNEEGILKDEALIPDDVHPAESGYRVWAEAMEPTLQRVLKQQQASE